jgi:hypothetical protein
MKSLALLIASVFIALGVHAYAFGQNGSANGFVSQEIDESDGIPVLIKHLPDWESVRGGATITNHLSELQRVLGERAVLGAVEFFPGIEAAVATYPAGTLLLIEHPTPQAASDAEQKIQQFLAGGQESVVYRRIGNYNALVFDMTDVDRAGALLDQVKYEKTIQWLGEDPFLLQKIDRYIATTGRDVAISTVIFIVVVLLSAVLIGVLSGLIFFRIRESKRAHMTRFSDAGGLTRLNLDDLAEPLRLE